MPEKLHCRLKRRSAASNGSLGRTWTLIMWVRGSRSDAPFPERRLRSKTTQASNLSCFGPRRGPASEGGERVAWRGGRLNGAWAPGDGGFGVFPGDVGGGMLPVEHPASSA